MEKELISFQMEIHILVIIKMVNLVDRGFINGNLEAFMKENLEKDLSME